MSGATKGTGADDRGEGKNIGLGIREIEIPGILMLLTLNDMVRNVEDLVYDNVMDVVKVRRQGIGTAPSTSITLS
jgi:predicted transcriptional regulator with HTH domain